MRLKTISILDAAHKLGWRVQGKMTPQLRLMSALNYLKQYNLTKVELDKSFLNPDNSINRFCFKQTEVDKLIKETNTNEK